MATRSELEEVLERAEELTDTLGYSVADLLEDVRDEHDMRHDVDGRQPWAICSSPVCRRFAEIETLSEALEDLFAR